MREETSQILSLWLLLLKDRKNQSFPAPFHRPSIPSKLSQCALSQTCGQLL